MSYCKALGRMKPEDQLLHRQYHDEQYGYPLESDDELFCRLVLEINQAGLSWTTILKKQGSFRTAYHNFRISKVAKYGQKDIDRLLGDPGVIRNRLKVRAAIENAKKIMELQQAHGSFKSWLDHHHPLSRDEWSKLFKKTFQFTGGEIVNEFLTSVRYLPGAHENDCPIYKKLIRKKPAWSQP